MEIAVYIAQDNPTRALKFVDELEDKCIALGSASGLGTPRADLGRGIRMFAHGRYLIFYREIRKALRIERIMHSARDIGDEDFEAPPLA